MRLTLFSDNISWRESVICLMKRVFFLPSKYSGRWRDWPHFDLAREKRNSPPSAFLLLGRIGFSAAITRKKNLPVENLCAWRRILPESAYRAYSPVFLLSLYNL